MKKNYREIQLTEYIDTTEPQLNYPLQIIGNIPMTAIQDIKTTINFVNATPAQMYLLKKIDFFWYRMMYWISYYRIGNLDRRLKPLSLKEFRNVEIFGELYASQLNLTIQLKTASEFLPKQFRDPFDWWKNQMLEIKQDWYFSVFHPLNNTKTQAVSDLNKCLQFMKGKDSHSKSLETMSSLTQDLVVRSQQFASGIAKKNKDFKVHFLIYQRTYKKTLDFIKGGGTKKGFQLAITKNDYIELSNQKTMKKKLIC